MYLYNQDPTDADNIIKPIQDALKELIYIDDLQVTDVESHRCPLAGVSDIIKYPSLLLSGILSKEECVYVRVTDSKPLEDYL